MIKTVRSKLRQARRIASDILPRVLGPTAKAVRVARAPLRARQRGRGSATPEPLAAAASEALAHLGYVMIEPDRKVVEMLTAARSVCAAAAEIGNTATKKFFKQLLTDELLFSNPTFMQVALDPHCLDILTGALGTVPYLESVELLLTTPETGALSQSQFFHCDRVDSHAYKQIIYIDDVDDDEGPFSFFPRPQSSRIPGWLPHYVADEDMANYVDFRELVEWKGCAGSRMLMDVRNCFHFGSRARKPRLAFFAYYNTGFGYYQRMRTWKGSFAERLPLTEQQRQALSLS